MNRLPIFPRTRISAIRGQEAPGMKGAQVMSSDTRSCKTAARHGTYRALYTNISDDQLEQIHEFFDAHNSGDLWQCVSHDLVEENCYFSEHQPFPGGIKHDDGGNSVDLVFAARYQE